MDDTRPSPEQRRRTEERPPARCRLLELPAELRAAVFMYVLPITTNHVFHGPCWIKGTTALLRTSKSVHDEATQLMYSRANFLVEVAWDITIFKCQSLSPLECLSRTSYPFPRCFGREYLPHMKRFKLMVHVADNHIPWQSTNHKHGSRLTLGIREQLERLHKVLEPIPIILELSLQFNDHFIVSKTDESVLRPILNLQNIHSVKFTGGISDIVRQQLLPS